jgi:hypothetical protein
MSSKTNFLYDRIKTPNTAREYILQRLDQYRKDLGTNLDSTLIYEEIIGLIKHFGVTSIRLDKEQRSLLKNLAESSSRRTA